MTEVLPTPQLLGRQCYNELLLKSSRQSWDPPPFFFKDSSASLSIKKWFSGGVYPGNTRPGQVPGTEHPHYLAPVMWGQPQPCARAGRVNPAVNTCWPLITRAKGQKEKNRCIPEPFNHFRSGVGSASRSCGVKLLNINKRDLTDIPRPGPLGRPNETLNQCGTLQLWPCRAPPLQKDVRGIKDRSNQPAAPPGLKERDQTHSYNLNLKWSRNGSSWDHRFTTLLLSCQTWRSGTGDMGQRWHGMFTWQGSKDLVIYTTMHHLLQQMGHSALTESC